MIRETIGALLILTAGLLIIAHCTGCVTERVLSAIEEAEYTLPYAHALDACRDEARKKPRPQQWEAYQTCEDRESAKLCERNPRLKAAWKRCMEVLP